MILFTDTGQIAHDLDTKLAEEVTVADTRALKDLGRAQSTRAEDDHLARFDLPNHKFSISTHSTVHYQIRTMVS